MQRGGVVQGVEGLGSRVGLAEVEAALALARHGHAPPAGGVARLRERQGLERAEAGLAHLGAHLVDQLQLHQRRFGLLHQDAVVLQGLEAALVERLVEQAFAGADRVGRIDDHHVHAAGRAVGHVGHAVVEQQFGAGVIVGIAQFREVLARHHGDLLVDIALGHALHALVLEHFAQGAAVAATDDDHALGRSVGEQHRMADHLVVEEVVLAGQHDGPVDGHQVAPVGGLEDLDLLERRLHLVQLAGDAEADGRASAFEVFDVPVAAVSHWITVLFGGLKPGWRAGPRGTDATSGRIGPFRFRPATGAGAHDNEPVGI